MPADGLYRIPVGPDLLGVVFDRPTTPGNIGTLMRSADAFGANGADRHRARRRLYDPRSVRASTGSLFALPTVRVPSHREVTDWLAHSPAKDHGVTLVGTDEHGDTDLADADLTGPTSS